MRGSQPRDAAVQAGGTVASVGPKKRILVVDDDEQFGLLTRLWLEKAGFRARFHRGPFGALNAIRESGCDLVVLDVAMPGLDGEQLVRLMRTSPGLGRIKVILFSGIDAEELRGLRERLEVAGCVPKVAARSALVEQVAAVLGA